jgi:hypothetical protein
MLQQHKAFDQEKPQFEQEAIDGYGGAHVPDRVCNAPSAAGIRPYLADPGGQESNSIWRNAS